MKALALFLVALLATSPAYAEPCTEAVSLKKGDVAFCDGDQLPVLVVEKLLNVQTALELAKKDLAELEGRLGDQLEACETNLEVERDLRVQCERTVIPPPKPPPSRPLTSEPWFVATVTAVLTAGLILGAQQLAR